jgi:hypothetical protein
MFQVGTSKFRPCGYIVYSNGKLGRNGAIARKRTRGSLFFSSNIDQIEFCTFLPSIPG